MTTDTGMVEKCGRTLAASPEVQDDTFDYAYDDRPEQYQAIVRVVLECLRTPTPEMVEAAYGQSTWYDLEVEEVMSEDIPAIWQAMIDAALSHTQGEGE